VFGSVRCVGTARKQLINFFTSQVALFCSIISFSYTVSYSIS
jgi:hypothetical protein